MSSTPPKYITGGCLCGAVRYRADFPTDHDFEKMVVILAFLSPPSYPLLLSSLPCPLTFLQSSICMCTQCRKQSGSLILHFHVVPLSSFRWMKPSLTISHLSQPSNDPSTTESTNTDLVSHDVNNPDKLPAALGDYQATPGNHRYFCKVGYSSPSIVIFDHLLTESRSVGA